MHCVRAICSFGCATAWRKTKGVQIPGVRALLRETRNGDFKVKHRTSRKKLGLSLRKFTDSARKARNVLTTVEIIRQHAHTQRM